MTRRLAREEGLFCGWSCGSAVAGALDWAAENELKKEDVLVIILPDHGTRYLGKVYSDSWMKDHGFLEERDYATARDIISTFDQDRSMLHVDISTTVSEAVMQLTHANVSQAPVTDNVLASIINRDNPAVLVPDGGDKMRIITQHDVLKAVTEA